MNTTIDSNDFLGTIVAPVKSESLIMVLGVGGAGGNAVNHMYDLGIQGVSFMVCNTDKQALHNSPIENQIVLGEGLGAGNNPAKGRQAAIETIDDIMIHLENSGARMIFITAGMGGGTGTGAAPVIAKAAKAKGFLTVGIVTLPFYAEGKVRMTQALKGLDELKENTDAIVVIHNDNITKIYGSLPFRDALHKSDDVLATAARGIAEMITREDFINVDFADVSTVMSASGVALMGSAKAKGERKISEAVENALASPLLNRQDIKGAKNILFNLSYSNDCPLTLDEVDQTLKMIQAKASRNYGGNDANIIWGSGPADLEEGEIELTIIATGFDSHDSRIEPQPPTIDEIGLPKENFGEEVKAEDDKMPQAPAVETKWKIKERYKNIDTMLMQPAFFRMGVNLTGASAAAKSSAKVQVESSTEEAAGEQTSAPKAAEQSLF